MGFDVLWLKIIWNESEKSLSPSTIWVWKKVDELLSKPSPEYIELESTKVTCIRVINSDYTDENIAKRWYKLWNNKDNTDNWVFRWKHDYETGLYERQYRCAPWDWPVWINSVNWEVPFHTREWSIIYEFEVDLLEAELYKNLAFETCNPKMDKKIKKSHVRVIPKKTEAWTFYLLCDDELDNLSPILSYSFTNNWFLKSTNWEFFLRWTTKVKSERIYRIINGEKVDITEKILKIRYGL